MTGSTENETKFGHRYRYSNGLHKERLLKSYCLGRTDMEDFMEFFFWFYYIYIKLHTNVNYIIISIKIHKTFHKQNMFEILIFFMQTFKEVTLFEYRIISVFSVAFKTSNPEYWLKAYFPFQIDFY